MSGSKVNDFSIGDSNIQSVMLTLDKAYKGLHQVSLTNYNNTSKSQIAAGSVVECGGALYKFDSNESITGSPSNGTVYIRLVPAGDSITAEYTKTAPTWSDSKQGWYGTGTDANKRYLEFVLFKKSSTWSKKSFNQYLKFNSKQSYIYLDLPLQAGILPGKTTKLQGASIIDTNAEWDNSIYRFTAKKTGYYNIRGRSNTSHSGGGSGITGIVYKVNNSEHTFDLDATPSYNFSYSTDIYLEIGDYVDFYYYVATSTTANFRSGNLIIQEQIV